MNNLPIHQQLKIEADRLIQQGWDRHQKKEFESALQPFQQALALYREIEDQEGEGTSVMLLAATYGDWGDNTKAIEYYQKGLTIAQETSNSSIKERALLGLGLCYAAFRDYTKAIEFYQQSLSIAQEISDLQGKVFALSSIGNVYYKQADYIRTSNNLKRDAATKKEVLSSPDQEIPSDNQDQLSEGSKLTSEGLEQFQQGQLREAQEAFQQALAISIVTGDRKLEGANLNNIGSIYRNQRQYQRALEFYKKALPIVREAGDTELESAILQNIAVVHSYQDQYQEALEFYEQALSMAQKLSNRLVEGKVLRNIGEVYYCLSQYKQALKFYEQALVVSRKMGDRDLEGDTLKNIGKIYHDYADQYRSSEALQLLEEGIEQLNSEQYQAALKTFQQALRIFRAINKLSRQESIGAPRRDAQYAEATTLLAVGKSYSAMAQYQEALNSYQQALAVSRELNQQQLIGEILAKIGEAYLQLGLYQKAFESYQQVLGITQELDDQEQEVNSLVKIGLIHLLLNQQQQALDSYQQALTILRRFNDPRREGTILNNIAVICQKQRQYQQALEYLQQALIITQKLQDGVEESQIFNNLGVIYYFLKDEIKARECFEKALIISKKVNNSFQEERALKGLQKIDNPSSNLGELPDAFRLCFEGLNQVHDGQSQDGLKNLERAITLFQEDGYNFGLGVSLLCTGQAYEKLRQYQQALNYYQQALDIFKSADSPTKEGSVDLLAFLAFNNDNGVATTLQKIGQVYFKMGQFQKALEVCEQALGIYKEVEDAAGESNTLSRIGMIYIHLSQYQKALEAFETAVKISTESEENLNKDSTALGGIGIAYLQLGQYQKALDNFQEALKISREAEDSGEGYLYNIGEAYRQLHQYQKALEFFEQSLVICRKLSDHELEGRTLNSMGIIYENLDQYENSLKCHLQALAISREMSDIHNEGFILNNIGFVYYQLDRYQQSLEYFRQALAIGRANKEPEIELLSLENIGKVLQEVGNFAEAETSLLNAVEVQESIRTELTDENKVSIFDKQIDTYIRLQQILIAQHKTELALEIAERGRARAFAELLAQRSMSSTDQLILPPPPNINRIKQIAKEQNATLVEYSIIRLEEALYVWVIQPTGNVIFRQVDLKTFGEQLLSINNVLANAEYFQIQHEQLRNLYQILIAPIVDLLPKNLNDRVIVIPFGDLFLIPFSALQDSNRQYVVNFYTIIIAPSIQILELIHRQRTSETLDYLLPALVVGNPYMPTIPLTEPPMQLISLPGSEVEAKVIALMLNTQAITGAAATKINIIEQMPKARLIHLATHGLLDDIRQLGIPGAIALAPSNDDNGFLTAGEIYDMKLNAELVVLSACSTGQGKVTGDGVIGLSRCLIAAGAKSVIVSLWSVGDLSTALLMVKFYQIFQQKLLASIALNEAQRWLREIKTRELEAWLEENQRFFGATPRMNLRRQWKMLDDNTQPYSHPLHWAAFFAIGQ